MMFIIGKVPPTHSRSASEILLQNILLKSLLRVGSKYRTVNMAQAFPSSFLKPLLVLSLASDPNVRLTVQQIFHQLLDRHCNLAKLKQPFTLSPLPALTMEKAYRQDLVFMKKNGSEIMKHIYENVQFANNRAVNYHAIYTTLALLTVELNSEDAVVELLRLMFALQVSVYEHDEYRRER